MKHLSICFLLILLSITKLDSQSVEGIYNLNVGGLLIDTLQLKSDNTFTYHRYQKFEKPYPDKKEYAKGTWKIDKNMVSFYVVDKMISTQSTC